MLYLHFRWLIHELEAVVYLLLLDADDMILHSRTPTFYHCWHKVIGYCYKVKFLFFFSNMKQGVRIIAIGGKETSMPILGIRE